jgi:hypothetical protein
VLDDVQIHLKNLLMPLYNRYALLIFWVLLKDQKNGAKLDSNSATPPSTKTVNMACFHQSKSTGKKDVQSNFEV